MDRKEAERFFNTQRHNCSDVELSRGAVYYPVSFITEILETYKRECVIEELEKIKLELKENTNELKAAITEARDNNDSDSAIAFSVEYSSYSAIIKIIELRISELKK